VAAGARDADEQRDGLAVLELARVEADQPLLRPEQGLCQRPGQQPGVADGQLAVGQRQRLLQELGREPTELELAEATGLDPIRMVELQSAPGAPVSLELPVGEDEEQELGDVLADTESASPEDIATTQTLKDEVQRVLESVLTPRERLVLQLRFGLGNSQAHPLEQVGRELGITRERVRQIEAGALAKLRQPPVLERLRG